MLNDTLIAVDVDARSGPQRRDACQVKLPGSAPAVTA
jgi:hypothetical protein